MDAPYEDPIITCPVDKAHRIAKSKLQKHLIKCLKANGLGDKMVCPFNSLHVIYISEKEKHMAECESYAKLCITSTELAEKPNYSGVVPYEEALDQVTKALAAFGETDQEEICFIDGPAYNPEEAKIHEPLFRSLHCESKSVRKNFRREEVMRHAALEAEQTSEMQDGNRRSSNAEPESTDRPTALENEDKKNDTHEGGSINQGEDEYIFTENEIFEEFHEYVNPSGTEDDDSSAIASPVGSKSEKKLIEGTETETDNLLQEEGYDNIVGGLLTKFKVRDI